MRLLASAVVEKHGDADAECGEHPKIAVYVGSAT
jgi:hypothetical protein